MTTPEIVVLRDYDGYFERLVRSWVERKEAEGGEFKHHTIQIHSGPYRSSAVSYVSKEGRITFDFYAALRTGFGHLSDEDVRDLTNLL